MDITFLAVPAVLALILKGILFAYARVSEVRNTETRLFLFFLFALSLQNLAEIGGFHEIASSGTFPLTYGLIYYAAGIAAIGLLLHLAATLALGAMRTGSPVFVAAVYGPMLVLQLLLWFTPYLVTGFEPQGYSYAKIAGPLYFMFEAYAIGYLVLVFLLLVFGSRYQDSPSARAKNGLTLFGLLPILLLVPVVVVLQHVGVQSFNATITLPIAVTFLLFVTAYATHQHRLFDIQFYLPWSKVRQRKTAFYQRIRAMIAEIADLNSVDQAVTQLAETLRCPVALIGGKKPALALAGQSNLRITIPEDTLRKFDHIVVRNEIAESMPEMHALMKNHGVAAVVPFHPHSEYASGWLLLGDSFSEQVYSRLDFKLVEQLFDKMADLLLDKLVAARTQLSDALREVRVLERQKLQMESEIITLRSEVTSLTQQNARLVKQQPADSTATTGPQLGGGFTLTLVGRDKAMLKALRNHFPQCVQYTTARSPGFLRQSLPDVLAWRVEESAAEFASLRDVIARSPARMGVVLYGEGVSKFVAMHKRELLGRLIEVLPEAAEEEVLLRRVQALSELGRHVLGVPTPDQPLIGQSDAFKEQIRQASYLARLIDPILIKTEDLEAGCALAAYLHHESGATGEFKIVRASDLSANDGELATEALTQLIAEASGGTLMVADLGGLQNAIADPLLRSAQEAGDVRVVAGCSALVNSEPDELMTPLHPFTLEMPGLRERKVDINLLVHYFTLQFNLQSGVQRYLRQSQVDDLLAERYPQTVVELRHSVFELLTGKSPSPAEDVTFDAAASDMTLDEQVAAFEASIITQTLTRCDGNKSKAARLLGLRPNTLHYKLERHKLGKSKG